MKKLITLSSVLLLLVLVSCETNETILDQQTTTESVGEMNFEKLFKIEKGVLTFTDKKSFDKLNEYIFSSQSNSNKLAVYLEEKSFNNLHSFYKDLQEEDLQEVFKTHKVTGELSKYFTLVPDAEGDYDLEETVKEIFLQLYFNRDLSFMIGKDYFKIKNDQLIIEKPTGEITELTSKSKNKNLKVKGTTSTSNYVTYENNDGRKFKLIVDTETRYGSVGISDYGTEKLFWNLIQYQATNRRRWAGIYYNTNTQSLRVYGDHYLATPIANSINQYTINWVGFDSNIYSDTDKVTVARERINSYNATAWCQDFDGVIHSVSISETNN